MMDFRFEQAPWEQALASLPAGSSLGVLRFLALMEDESEEVLEEAFLDLEVRGITLDISELPKAGAAGEAAVRLHREEQLVQQGADLLTALEENDPLRLYLEEVAALPAAGDIQQMAQRYAGGYETVLPGLTNLMLSRVIEMAKAHVGRGVLLLDLIQEGSLGLWQGILSYRSGDFESHAIWWIQQYLARAITLQARQMGVGQKMQQAMEDYRQVDERLLTELGRNPTSEELAQALHLTEPETEAVRRMLESARILQAAHAAAEPEPEAEAEAQHVEDTAYFQSRQRIEEMLSDLPADAKWLLQLRFGLEGGKPLSPEETGRILGLTPEEVVTREAEALQTLRRNNR